MRMYMYMRMCMYMRMYNYMCMYMYMYMRMYRPPLLPSNHSIELDLDIGFVVIL